jgi:hypothetical protein
VVAVYAMLLLAALRAYGPQRTSDYLPPPKWGRPPPRPSLLDLISLLRKQCQEAPQAIERFEIQTTALDLVLKAAASRKIAPAIARAGAEKMAKLQTQAKAWAKFPRPFGPKPAPKFDRLPGYLEWQFAIAPDARLSPAPNESQDLIPRL